MKGGDIMAKTKKRPDHEEIHLPKGFESLAQDSWGTRMTGWIRRNFSSVILPIIALIVLGGGIYLYSQQRQPTPVPDQLAGINLHDDSSEATETPAEDTDATEATETTDEPEMTDSSTDEEPDQVAVTDTETESTHSPAGEAPSDPMFGQGGPTFDIEQSDRSYLLTANSGEGITHLARRALLKYVDDRDVQATLTDEHAVYIEDFVQNAKGDFWLDLGQQLTIELELIQDGIDASQSLSDAQLSNLTQFSSLVSSLNYSS